MNFLKIYIILDAIKWIFQYNYYLLQSFFKQIKKLKVIFNIYTTIITNYLYSRLIIQ